MTPALRHVLFGGYISESVTAFARFTTPPTDQRKSLINRVLVDLKLAGVLPKLDALYLHAAADAQAARQNLVRDAYNLTEVNAPTFTADRGYTGNGSTAQLNTGFNPATAAGRFSLNSASQFVWVRTGTSATTIDIGNFSSRICPSDGSGQLSVRPNNGGAPGVDAGQTATGLSAWSRNNATHFDTYKNGALIANKALASANVDSVAFTLLSQAGAAYSARQISATGWGAALTAGEMAALHAALNAYLTAVGAV